jgi:hypothetical protein
MRDAEPRVVEHGSEPARSCVTCRTGGREPNGDVVRIRGGVVIRFVAAVAVGRQRGVVAIHMAVGTWNRGVSPSERKSRGVVIKLSVGPKSSVVAKLAGCGETYLDVVNRSRRRVVILQVAC